MFRPLTIVPVALAAACLIGVGCDSGPEPASLDNVVFDIDASNSNPLEGEIVTFTVDAYNTLGRDTDIRWETTGGDIVERQLDDTAIQVQFDEEGEYIVSADLFVDGDRIRSDSVKIVVSEVR